jgi:hypothetical protein
VSPRPHPPCSLGYLATLRAGWRPGRLDQAENATLSLSNQNKKSYNLDDTGFFSISVLERALQVWDLTLVRWRGEAMKPYQEHPEWVHGNPTPVVMSPAMRESLLTGAP